MTSLSVGTAIWSIARLSFLRFKRSKIIWIAFFLAAMPLISSLIRIDHTATPDIYWEKYVREMSYIQMLVATLLMSPIIAEEIVDKTYTYLWSRPIARWTVFAGKILAGWSISLLIVVVYSIGAAFFFGFFDIPQIVQAFAGFSLGTLAVGCIGASIGTLLPKYTLASSLLYFLVLDATVSSVLATGARASIMHNVIAITGFDQHANTFPTSLSWILGITSFWTLIGLWRLSSKEFSTGS